jgi:asparagine synthase (glutamine-hydrolysing)
MSGAAGRHWIVYNGEIYNYQELRRELEARGATLASNSDTEVILASYRRWGVDCLEHLNGMFAFALYDSDKRLLFLARDRAGEKPLFYYQTPSGLMFASELKALMASPGFPRRIDADSLNYYLTYGYVAGERCILRGVKKLPPAHAMTYDLKSGSARIWRYWNLPESSPDALHSPRELTDRLEGLLSDSVRLRLIADVPVGVLLSGGLDSSLITAMAARASSRPVQTFTAVFPEYVGYNEGPFGRQVADYFGTQHCELVIEPKGPDILSELARQYDEPIADSSMIPVYLICQLVRQHVTVGLGGDGGDELFGGYKHYCFLQRLSQLHRLIPGSIRHGIGETATHLPVGTWGRNHLIGFGSSVYHSIAHVNLYFDTLSRSRLLSPTIRDHIACLTAPESHKVGLCRPSRSVFQNAAVNDFLGVMAEAYLVKLDRASMLASLETRAPFLDHRLVEFAFGELPDHLRATRSSRKVLLRRLAQRVLPPNLNLTRKQGFTPPLGAWLHGTWGTYAREVLDQADPGLFDRSTIHGLLSQHRGIANSQRLFAVVMFELWRRCYSVTL